MNPIFIKPILIQLTLQEVEIGVDLSLLDSIRMQWIAFNEYDKLAELEVAAKKIELATSIAAFGEQEDVNGITRKSVPIAWIIKNYLDYNTEQLSSMESERRKENIMLGFPPDETIPEDDEFSDEESDDDEKIPPKKKPELRKEKPKDIRSFDDDQYK